MMAPNFANKGTIGRPLMASEARRRPGESCNHYHFRSLDVTGRIGGFAISGSVVVAVRCKHPSFTFYFDETSLGLELTEEEVALSEQPHTLFCEAEIRREPSSNNLTDEGAIWCPTVYTIT